MTRMNTTRKLTLVVGVVLALAMLAGPAVAVESDQAPASSDGDHRVAIAETPRDRLGLLLLGALVVGSGVALVNARRQLKGERPQASGEFRWR